MFGQLLLNILIAFLWVLLQDEDTFEFSTLFAGFFSWSWDYLCYEKVLL